MPSCAVLLDPSPLPRLLPPPPFPPPILEEQIPGTPPVEAHRGTEGTPQPRPAGGLATTLKGQVVAPTAREHLPAPGQVELARPMLARRAAAPARRAAEPPPAPGGEERG